MATNADDILNSADVSKEANASTDLMAKHFEMAGIEDAEEGATTEGEDASAKSGEAPAPKGDKEQEADKSASNSGAKDGDTKPGVDSKTKKEEGPALNPGDLKLPDGSIVKAGAERRHYETAKIERQRSADLSNQLKQMQESRDAVRQQMQQLQQTVQTVNGAEPQLVAVGVRMARDLQRDPVGTLQKLLAEATAAGYTIEGIGAGVDKLAIERIIANNTMQQQQQIDPEVAIQQEVQQEIAQFYTKFPDAKIHDGLIGRVLNDHPELTLDQAYYELKSSFIQRDLDWSKPLEAQAPSADQKQQQPNTKQMPNGRQGVDPVPARKVAVAHESTDMSDIIKAAMRENGLNI